MRVHHLELFDLAYCGFVRGLVRSFILHVKPSYSPMTGFATIYTRVRIATSWFFVVTNWSPFLTSEHSLVIRESRG